MKKLISLVINIANDNYYEDLIYRIQKTLDLNLFFLNKLKDKKKVEIIYVDWGSKKKISDCIFVHKNFKNQVKFIHVNEKLSKKKSKYYPNYFNHDISFNVGIRKTEGMFILQTASDQFFNASSWINLISYIKNKYLSDKQIYLVPRKIIDTQMYLSDIDNKNYKIFFDQLNSTNFKYKPHTFYTGGGFSTMISRKNFFLLRGMNEHMIPGTSNDGELILRSNLMGLNKVNTDNFGVYMYKFPPLKNSLRNALVYSKNLRKKPLIPKKVKTNNINWGLKNKKFNVYYSKNLSKNFENSKEFLRKNSSKNKIGKLEIFKILLNTNKFYIKNFFDLKKTFQLINIIKIFKINKFIEIGFSNLSTLDIIGNYFKYLDIISFDKKNYDSLYYNEVGQVVRSFDLKRYGLFHSIISKNDQILFDYLKNNHVKGNINLFTINNKKNYNLYKNLFMKLTNKRFNKFVDFIITDSDYIFGNKRLLVNLKKTYQIYTFNKKNIFLFKSKHLIIEKQKLKKLYLPTSRLFFPYLSFIFYEAISKLLKYIRSLFHSVIK